MKSTMQHSKLSVPSLLRHGLTLFPNSKVFTFDGASSSVQTFFETAQRAARLANALKSLGINRDDRVATFCFNHNVHLEAYLAIPSSGAILHTLNIRLFSDQLQFIIEDSGDKVIIADGLVLGLLAKVLPRTPSVTHVIVNGEYDPRIASALSIPVLDYEELLRANSDHFDWIEPADETDAAALCYTSGTTGDPKGVVYSHRSTWLHSNAVTSSASLGLSGSDRCLVVVPMFHVNAWGIPYAAWMVGCDLVLPGRYLQAAPLAKMISDLEPTIASGVPVIWNDLVHFAEDNPVNLKSLRILSSGGSAAPRSLIEAFRDRFDIPMIQGWGMTETSPICTLAVLPRNTPKDKEIDYLVTAGRPVPGVSLRVVDEDGKIVPNDGKSLGEIEVSGPWITESYYKDRNPECFDGFWLRTGDIGFISNEGYLTISDRTKDVIKSGGEWISSVELENALMAHEAIYEASIVGVRDDRWIERPLACIVLRPGFEAKPEELRDFLVGKVARWWLPERWTFLSEIPKTSVGKFDKKVLRKMYSEHDMEVTEIIN